MTKEAYYFSHDANARQDPKILEMMSVYGAEGYGWYWILVEMLREQSDFTLKLQGKYTYNALAMQMHCKPDASKQFVHDCIYEFGLFQTDSEYFWSDSLIRRMAMKEEISQKRRKAAEARWGKNADKSTKTNKSNASAMQMHNKSNANGMQGKEKKVKEIKVKKDKYRDYVFLSEKEYQNLVSDYGQAVIDSKIEDLDNYIGNKKKDPYVDHNRTLRTWIKKDGIKKLSERKEEHQPTKLSVDEKIKELDAAISLTREYYEMTNEGHIFDEMKKERERLEQLRTDQRESKAI